MVDHLAAAEATGKRRSDGSWRRGTWIGGFGVRSESSVTKKFQRKAMEEGGPASPLMMGTSGGAGASATTGKKWSKGRRCRRYSGGRTREGLEACLHERRSIELAG
jgi:hypothetical protein